MNTEKNRDKANKTAQNETEHSRIMLNSDAIYSVYLHHKYDKNSDSLIRWEKRDSTPNKEDALQKARSLYRSYPSDKVEVTKSIHCRKDDKIIDKTIKIYGKDDMETVSLPIKAALGILIICLTSALGFWIISVTP